MKQGISTVRAFINSYKTYYLFGTTPLRFKRKLSSSEGFIGCIKELYRECASPKTPGQLAKNLFRIESIPLKSDILCYFSAFKKI